VVLKLEVAGAVSGEGGEFEEENPTMRQRMMVCSSAARERMRSEAMDTGSESSPLGDWLGVRKAEEKKDTQSTKLEWTAVVVKCGVWRVGI
jgi:hypothetical protein